VRKVIEKKPKTFNLKKIYRFFIFIAISITLVATVTIGRRPYRGGLQEGDIATETVYAPFDFTVRGEIDQQATEKLKEENAHAIPDIYSLDDKINATILSEVDAFFAKINEAKNIKDTDDEHKIKILSKAFPQIEEKNLENLLKEKDIKTLALLTKEILSDYLIKGIISSKDKDLLLNSGKERILLKFPQKENVIEIQALRNVEECEKNIKEDLREKIKNRYIIEGISQFINSKLTANLFYNEQETTSRKQKARKATTPVYKKITIAKNEIIIAKNQRVTKDHIAYLQELLSKFDEKQRRNNRFFFTFGMGVLSIFFVILGAIYFVLFRKKFISETKNLILIGLLSVFIILISKLITLSFASSYIIPLASISMCLAILIDYEIASMLTIILSLFIGIMTGNKLPMTIVSMVGGLVGVYAVRQARRRSQILSAGLLVGVANFLCIAAIGLLQNLNYNVFLKDGLWGVGNGILSSFIVMGVLPILEYSFKITTNISLLELSDLNHPLLKEMVLSAPGTYHHSLIVGNLAEAAADAIGANSLLARVASYYHDIGKVKNAEYFAENKIESKDKHTKLQPKMSNLIITNHVKEGQELAKKYKLSPPILDIIQQHHGTSLTFYFYQRALEEEDESKVKEEEFRYPGPKPQTKEAAIVLLADSVEAASRTIAEPTAAKIEKMVHRIINNKFIDGQLDECDLTLKDLHKIAESFTRILVGIYHSRIHYPGQEEELKSQEP
jgi:hypothetical protein